MHFTRTGIILNAKNYAACRDFYGQILGLPLLYQLGAGSDEITVFDPGGSYLMVEHGGVSHTAVKPIASCPTKFRFNVADMDTACAALRAKGVELTVLDHDWGVTAELSDPDGNRCALRSDEGFGVEVDHAARSLRTNRPDPRIDCPTPRNPADPAGWCPH